MIRLQLNQFAPMRVAWNFMEILRKLNFDRWRCRSWTAFSSQMPFAPGISGKFCCATPRRIKLRDSCCRSRWLYEDIYSYSYILIHAVPIRTVPYHTIELHCVALHYNAIHYIAYCKCLQKRTNKTASSSGLHAFELCPCGVCRAGL